jgi:Gas vesicle synthesis protein GvpL/GvpF
MNSAYYLYAFTRPETRVDSALTGVAGGRLEVITAHGLGVIAEAVNATVFKNALKAHDDDPTWIAQRALHHDTVINQHLTQGVLPLRFGTLLEDRSAVDRLLFESSAMRTRLDALRGKLEFSVRVWADHEILTPRLVKSNARLEDLQVQIESAASGTAYLLQRRFNDGLALALRGSIPQMRALACSALSDVVDGLRPFERLPKPQGGNPGILEAAVLLEARGQALLQGELAQWQDRLALIAELSGPFAPYNFVQDPEEMMP